MKASSILAFIGIAVPVTQAIRLRGEGRNLATWATDAECLADWNYCDGTCPEVEGVFPDGGSCESYTTGECSYQYNAKCIAADDVDEQAADEACLSDWESCAGTCYDLDEFPAIGACKKYVLSNCASEYVATCMSTTSSSSAPTASPTTATPTQAPSETASILTGYDDKVLSAITDYKQWYEPRFGTALFAFEEYMIVGAPGRDKAFIYFEDELQAELEIASPSSYDAFGQAVAINSEYALVAAPFHSNSMGLVSVYIKGSDGTWSFLQDLEGGESSNSFFGFSVDIDASNQVIIGGSGGGGRGGVWLYTLDSSSSLFVLESKISGSSGAAVSIDGDYAASGTGGDGVLVFEKTSDGEWTKVADISCASCAQDEHIGDNVALSGSTLVFGSTAVSAWPSSGDLSGQVLVYTRDSFTSSGSGMWFKSDTIRASDGSDDDYFGQAVAFTGDVIVVGAYGYDQASDSDVGRAYKYVLSGSEWVETILAPSSLSASDKFGEQVAVTASYMAVSAPNDDDVLNNGGAVYIYDL